MFVICGAQIDLQGWHVYLQV